MTDKATREAFEKWAQPRALDLTWENCYGDPGWQYIHPHIQSLWKGFDAGYQAAHDAAMAAEPGVSAAIEHLDPDNEAIRHYSQLQRRRFADVLSRLLLQLQAAQQREAECRKDAERIDWINTRLHAVDFEYRPDPDAPSFVAVILNWPSHVHLGISMRENIDEARAALATQPTSKGETT